MSDLKIIGIASGKGGVGKTTISTNRAVADDALIARSLSNAARRVGPLG